MPHFHFQLPRTCDRRQMLASKPPPPARALPLPRAHLRTRQLLPPVGPGRCMGRPTLRCVCLLTEYHTPTIRTYIDLYCVFCKYTDYLFKGIVQLPSLSLPIATYLQQAPDARQHATTSTVSAAEVSITPPDQAPSPTSQQGAPPSESNSQVRVPATQHRPPCVRT